MQVQSILLFSEFYGLKFKLFCTYSEKSRQILKKILEYIYQIYVPVVELDTIKASDAFGSGSSPDGHTKNM